MRLGGPVEDFRTPEEWVSRLKAKEYRAAYCPVTPAATPALVEEYRLAARENDIVIAEVGAWGNNPLSSDRDTARAGVRNTIENLALAEAIQARCCVNVAGSPGPRWEGPHPDNLSRDTFRRLVTLLREIIDAVQPTRTVFALEPMPHMLPTSPEQIIELLEAVDRPGFGVHLDTVNMINGVDRYMENAAFTRHCFARLGGHIRVVHVKDCRITGGLPVCIEEVPLGEGEYDLSALIACAGDYPDADLPMMLEHLPDMEAYDRAAAHFRRVAGSLGVEV